ncbi:MAG: endonuclease V [Thermoanaerobaculia bacterium]|nr:endonuclease V [Thermoanaerobaculia bacterium]
MIGFVDVGYDETNGRARAGLVIARGWTEAVPVREVVVIVEGLAPYQPGEFYRRELPPLLAVLGSLPELPQVVVVDGFVWLDGDGKAGLGAHLHRALEGKAAVVGVAKTWFQGAGAACEVYRGNSKRPLFVSAVGLELDQAADAVQAMAGSHRVPSLIRWADQLSRGAEPRTSL